MICIPPHYIKLSPRGNHSEKWNGNENIGNLFVLTPTKLRGLAGMVYVYFYNYVRASFCMRVHNWTGCVDWRVTIALSVVASTSFWIVNESRLLTWFVKLIEMDNVFGLSRIVFFVNFKRYPLLKVTTFLLKTTPH